MLTRIHNYQDGSGLFGRLSFNVVGLGVQDDFSETDPFIIGVRNVNL